MKFPSLGASCRALCGGLLAAPASAATYPDKPVKVIVPFAAGGPTDVMARLIAQKLSESLKQQFFVENQPGAGGNIGMTIAAVRPPTATPSWWQARASWSIRAFTPKIPMTRSRTSRRSRWRPPRRISWWCTRTAGQNRERTGRSGQGQPGQIFHRQSRHRHDAATRGGTVQAPLKLDATSIPFGGAAPAIQSTVAGHTPIAFTALPPTAPQVKGGKLRALAVTSAKRSRVAGRADLGGTGIKEQVSETMQGVLAPAGTPKAIVDLLNAESSR